MTSRRLSRHIGISLALPRLHFHLPLRISRGLTFIHTFLSSRRQFHRYQSASIDSLSLFRVKKKEDDRWNFVSSEQLQRAKCKSPF